MIELPVLVWLRLRRNALIVRCRTVDLCLRNRHGPHFEFFALYHKVVELGAMYNLGEGSIVS